VPDQLPAAYPWSTIGGHLALDLCNTVSWRLDPGRRVDRLGTGPDLVAWFDTVIARAADSPTGSTMASGIGPATGTDLTSRTDLPITRPIDRDRLIRHAADHPLAAEKALSQIKELRDGTTRVLDHQLGRGATEPGDVDRIATAWRQALAVAGTREELPWRWRIEPVEPGDLVPVLALSVADLLHRADPSRLRRCDGEGCGWLFLDTTRNHSRRWCDPLDCGNRTRVRQYAERRRMRSR
jgi:predicted RNA-binding Zn ribbon-like protein